MRKEGIIVNDCEDEEEIEEELSIRKEIRA